MSVLFVDKNFYRLDNSDIYQFNDFESKLFNKYLTISQNKSSKGFIFNEFLIVKLKDIKHDLSSLIKINDFEIRGYVDFVKDGDNFYRIYDVLLYSQEDKNCEERAYLNLLKEVIYKGDYRETRNAKTLSLFGRTLKFDLKDKYPLLTTKRTFFRGVIEELIFFLQGKTNSKLLEDKGINIWKGNTNKEFLEKMNLHYEEGDMGPMYGFNWVNFGAEYKGMNNNYENEGLNQLKDVVQLLKNDVHSRRILFTTYNPEVAKDGVLYPCHGLISQFYVTERDGIKYLSLNTYQRSADAFLGLPFNIASYGAMVYIFCKILGPEYKPDELIINLGDIHIYEQHIEQCLEQISRECYDFPKLNIKDFEYNYDGDFSKLKYEDFELINYKCHPTIKADMVA